MKSSLKMFQGRKLLVLLSIMFVLGTSMGSESSKDMGTPKHFSSQDIGIAEGLMEPLKYDPKNYLDINEQESKKHLTKNLPELAVLGSLAGQYTKLETRVEPAKSDVPKNSTESFGSAETEKLTTANNIGKVKEYAGDFLIKLKATQYPVTPKTNLIPIHQTSTNKPSKSANVTQEATISTGSAETEKPQVTGTGADFEKVKEQIENWMNKLFGTKAPVTHQTTLKPTHQTSTTKSPESSDVTQETTKSSGSTETEKPPATGLFGKLKEKAGNVFNKLKVEKEREAVKVEESSESNALRTYDASLACIILNLVLLVVSANSLIF